MNFNFSRVMIPIFTICFFFQSCRKERVESNPQFIGIEQSQIQSFFDHYKKQNVYFAGEGQSYQLDWSNAVIKKSGGEEFLQFKVTDDVDIVFANVNDKLSCYYNKHQALIDSQSGKTIDFVISVNLEDGKEYIAAYFKHRRMVFLPINFFLKKMTSSIIENGKRSLQKETSHESTLKNQLLMTSFWQHVRCWITFSVWKENGEDGPGCYGLDLQQVWDTIKAFVVSDDYNSYIAPPDFGSIQNLLSWGNSTGLADYSVTYYSQYYGYQTPDGNGTVDPNNTTTIGEIGGIVVPPDVNLLIDLVKLAPSAQDFFLNKPFLANKIVNYVLENGGNTADNRIFVAWVQSFLTSNPTITEKEFDNFLEAIRQNSYRPRDRAPATSPWRAALSANGNDYNAVFTKSQPQILSDGNYNPEAFNCHYWAFKDQAKETLAAENQPKWVISVDFSKFNLVTGNVQVGDRIIYLKPYKGLPNGWLHSGIVVEVDNEGYATKISSKMGDYDVIEHHPRDIPSDYGSPEPTFTLNNKEYPSRMYYRLKN